jgi:very-short-patch-repair endonuclease
LVTRRQLLRAGLSDDVVDVRIGRGLLTRVHRGVFQVGPIVAPRASEMAACLACGNAAFVGHRSAAALSQLLPPDNLARKVEIVLRRGIRRHPAIHIRRACSLRDAEVAILDGIPVTTPARTILDLAASASPRELERALAEALARHMTTRGELQNMLAHARGRRGTAALRAWLEGRGPALTRSEAEERFLALVRRAQLPEPRLNVRVAGFEVDFLWRSEMLVAEVDGFAFHADATAFENDRRRDLALTSTGLRVVRITWQQLVNESEIVLVRLAQALVRR